jgi:hypothetical protein
MPQLSPEQLAPMMANVETTVGTRPATFVPNTQGFLSINSPNPITPDFGFQDILPHSTGWTKQKSIPTTALQPVNFLFPMTGGTSATAGWRHLPILQAAGCKATTGANIALTPIAPADAKSATFAVEMPGYQVGVTAESVVLEANGCFGSAILRGTFDGGFMGEFRGLGLYLDPAETTLKAAYGGGSTAWSGGTNNANKFILSGSNRIKLNNGGSDYFPMVGSYEFDLGVEYLAIKDINAGSTFGIYSIMVVDRNPRLTLVIGLDTLAASGISYQDINQDAQDGTTWSVGCVYTDLSGRTITIAVPTAQVIGVRLGTAQRVRSVAITLKPQSATPEGEWTITHA